MSQSTEVARRSAAVHDLTDTRKVEAHAIVAQTHITLAAAMVELYARTQGLPLAPIGSWYFHATPRPSMSGHLDHDYTSPAHVRRQQLQDWADALGTEVTESRGYGSKVTLKATLLIGDAPVSVQVDVDHYCTCTGQCNGGTE